MERHSSFATLYSKIYKSSFSVTLFNKRRPCAVAFRLSPLHSSNPSVASSFIIFSDSPFPEISSYRASEIPISIRRPISKYSSAQAVGDSASFSVRPKPVSGDYVLSGDWVLRNLRLHNCQTLWRLNAPARDHKSPHFYPRPPL